MFRAVAPAGAPVVDILLVVRRGPMEADGALSTGAMIVSTVRNEVMPWPVK